MTGRSHRKGLTIFFAIVVVVSGVLEWRLTLLHEPIERHLLLALGLMWTPALAALTARLVGREGLGDVSFRLGGARGLLEMLRTWLFPVAVCGCAYGLAWMLGVARFTTHQAMLFAPPSSVRTRWRSSSPRS